MEKYSVYVPKLLPKQENFIVGRRSCRGCGKALAIRFASKAMAECGALIKTDNKPQATGYAWDDMEFPSLVGSVVRSVRKSVSGSSYKKPTIAIDMKAFDGSLVALQSMLEKTEDILVILYDNEKYMDTLIMESKPLPFGIEYHHHAPGAKEVRFALESRNLFNFAEKLSLSYAASSSIAYPFDLVDKVKRGLKIKGTAVVHVNSPCPTGWMFAPADTVKLGALAVESGFNPVWEYKDGKFSLNMAARKPESVKEYVRAQKRYRYMSDAFIETLNEAVRIEFEKLQKICGK